MISMYDIHIFICDIPHGKAVLQSTDDPFLYNIFASKYLSDAELKEQVRHEVSHIMFDDLYSLNYATDIEEEVRNREELTDEFMETINFRTFYTV